MNSTNYRRLDGRNEGVCLCFGGMRGKEAIHWGKGKVKGRSREGLGLVDGKGSESWTYI